MSRARREEQSDAALAAVARAMSRLLTLSLREGKDSNDGGGRSSCRTGSKANGNKGGGDGNNGNSNSEGNKGNNDSSKGDNNGGGGRTIATKEVSPWQASVIRSPESAKSAGDLAEAARLLVDLEKAVLKTSRKESVSGGVVVDGDEKANEVRKYHPYKCRTPFLFRH